ncbi:MAG: chemotaxis protein CheW [Gallionella sp.]|nr:chemotaxis protein CheW [Gallionella sp.]
MSKRLNLRDFQQNLSNRMQDKSRDGGHLSLLGVQIAAQNYLVEMVDISEVLSLPPLTAVPLTKHWFRGVVNVRGNLFCVADMAAFLYQVDATGDAGNRLLLTAERHSVNAALLVDRVFGLRDSSSWRRDAVDADQYFDEQGVMWRKLDVVGLLAQPDFLQIGI